MYTTSFRYLNHASILIHCADSFILTDPWFERPAFGSWLPVPPMAIHPAYIQTLARCTHNFMIVISHGHDDHIDDEWLANFPKDVLVLIPKFPAPGTRKRIEVLGFKKIIEIPEQEIRINNTRFCAFFNPEISRFDAIVSIDTGDSLIIHANDNWKPLTLNNREALSVLVKRYGSERTCYLSQCNMADSFPYVYPQYNAQEQKSIANSRVENITRSSLKNAAQIGARYFLNYAGHTKTFDDYNPHMLELTGFRDHQFLQTLALLEGLDSIEVLDMVPGDSFDFVRVEKLFGMRLDESILKEESVSYYRSYGVDKRCDTYRLPVPNIASDSIAKMAEKFLFLFYHFIIERAKKINFRPEIMEQSISIVCDEFNLYYTLMIKDGLIIKSESKIEKHTIFDIPSRLLVPILRGELNLENVLVGGQCKVYKYPKDFYNGAIIFWLSMFAYFYLHNCSSARVDETTTKIRF
jgi:hypothetical protein